jgi:hypothetical protein
MKCRYYFLRLKMEAVFSSETLVIRFFNWPKASSGFVACEVS